jgi:hypothetical protein
MVLAPLTKLITIVCTISRANPTDFKPNTKPVTWKATIHSLYPGPHVQLGWKEEHRIIQPEQAVFFRFDHPGELID